MRHRICVPIASENIEKIKSDISNAFDNKADFVEIRFDYVSIMDIDVAINTALSVKDRAVFTLRSNLEGGRFVGSETDRIKLLRKFVLLEPMFVDIELKTLIDNPDFAKFLIESKNKNIIISWHCFDYTPSNNELYDIIRKCEKYSNHIKVVTMANTVEDGLRVLSLYDGQPEKKLIAFSMGDYGVISRILCPVYGNAPFTYASLYDPIAPGQISLAKMRKLYDRISSNKSIDVK